MTGVAGTILAIEEQRRQRERQSLASRIEWERMAGEGFTVPGSEHLASQLDAEGGDA